MEYEQRRIIRRHLIFYLEVIDIATNQLIARLADMHEEGLLLIASSPLQDQELFEVRINVPKDAEPPFYSFSATIRVQWVAKDLNPKYYKIGCSFASIAKQDLEMLSKIIENYAFDDKPVVLPYEKKF